MYLYVHVYINNLNEVHHFGLIMSQGHMLSKKTLVPGSEGSLGVVDRGVQETSNTIQTLSATCCLEAETLWLTAYFGHRTWRD